jgi:hypothetical protein
MRTYLPKQRERRIVQTFICFPFTLDNERRWMESALIEQIYLDGEWICLHWADGKIPITSVSNVGKIWSTDGNEDRL